MRKIPLIIFIISSLCRVHIVKSQGDQGALQIQTSVTGNLIEIFEKLEKHHSLSFVYSPSLIPSGIVSITEGTYDIRQLIKTLENQADIKITIASDLLLVSVLPKKYTLSGFVKDDQNNEILIGATVRVADQQTGTITNNYGYFSLSLPPALYVIETSFFGYEVRYDTVDLNSSKKFDFTLKLKTMDLDEVVLYSMKPLDKLKNTPAGSHTLGNQQRNQIPYFLSETDIIQEALLLPGIKTLGEDASGLIVRGGGIDQNLILFDEAVIYNPNHFFGLISIFNPDAINQVQVMKGFIHPQYGGRASSVINVFQREGNNKDFQVSGGIGLVSARLMAEGPIQEEKSSFLVSARQSLLDLSFAGGNITQSGRSRTAFQDVNLKLNFRPSDKNTYYISGYLGNDRNRTGLNAIRNWGNQTVTARWNHTYNSRWFSHVSAFASSYRFRIEDPVEVASFIGRSNVTNYNLKIDNEYHHSPSHLVQFGVQTTWHDLRPGVRLPFNENSSLQDTLTLQSERALEYAAYASHEIDLNNQLKLLYGIRFSGLHSIGPQERYVYDENMPKSTESIIDTLQVGKWSKNYGAATPEPRVAVHWMPTSKSSIKMAYSRTAQYIHLISNTAAPAPTDIWKLSNHYIPANISNQFSIGYFHHFFDGMIHVSVETYLKLLNALLEYKDGADLLFNENLETALLVGKGRAYGVELMIEKPNGKFHGWISYALSRSERQTVGRFREETINDGEFYPENHDKPHDLNTVLIWDINKRWNIASTFNYSTGRPITFPVGKYEFNGIVIPHFEGRNQNRISDYHRLDISVMWTGKTTRKDGLPKKYTDNWTFSIYNIYGRKNAYSYFFRPSATDPNITEIVRFSIFDRVIPSVSYNFRF